MAIRSVIDLQADQTIKMEKVGQKAQGYYIGFKTVTTGFGPSKLHVFSGEGGTLGIWGGAQLDAKLATVPKGALTFVTFTTASVIKNGKRTPKGYEVKFDDEEIIDTSNIAVNVSSEPTEEASETPDSEPADTDPYEAEADDSDTEEQLPPPSAPPRRGVPTPISSSTKDKALAALAKARLNAAKA